jgi:hypothetical protein
VALGSAIMDRDPYQAGDFHHLRTHLTLIKGNTQLAQRAALRINDPPSSLVASLEIVLTHVEQLIMLLAEIEARASPCDTKGGE